MFRLLAGLVLGLMFVAGSAAAQQGSYGSKPKVYGATKPATSPYAPTYKPAYGAPAQPRAGGFAKIYEPPEAPKSPGFKPYEGYKGQPATSLFGPDRKPRR